MNKLVGKIIFNHRKYEIAKLSGGNSNEELIIFRGFQGINIAKEGKSHSYGKWNHNFHKFGYNGHIFNYRWPSDLVDGLGLELASKEAAECFWKIVEIDKPFRISLVGFSTGGRIIQHILKKLARKNIKMFNNVYLFGSLARNDESWPMMLRPLKGNIYNYFSPDEETLASWYIWLVYSSDISGISEIPFHHHRIKNFNCKNFVTKHEDWEDNLMILLKKSGLNPNMI